MGGDPERLLVARCRRGDREAQTSLLRQYSARVFAICYGLLGNRHDAEDAAQETLLKALRDMARLKDEAQFGAWVRRIAQNLCIDILRSRKRHRKAVELKNERTPSESKDYRELAQALRELPAESRETLLLYYFERRSVRAMAEMLSISEDAACARLSRARRKLRRRLEAEGD